MTEARHGHELDAPPWSRVEGTLMSTARDVRRAYDHRLQVLGLNLAEASVLAHLARTPPVTQAELARRVGKSRARLGVQIETLAAKGAVERRTDPADGRVWLITITPRGVALWEQAVEVDRAIRTALRAGTTRAQRAQLDAVLTTIHRNALGLLDAPAP